MTATVRKFNNNNATHTNSCNLDTVGLAFKYLNAFKRNRALAEAARQENDMSKAIYNELKQYKNLDGLELALRAIQKGLRELDEVSDD